jgi:endonuclease/exonuclease/phosphatase family metal-dependent hydrolase
VGKQSREEATRLVIQQIQEKCGPDPYLLTGDFNFNQQDANYTYITDIGLLVDAYESARVRWAENGSFNGFNVHHKTDNRIDFVFHSPHFVVDKYGVLTYIYWTEKPTEEKENEKEREQKLFIPRVMSDHFPISVKLEFPRKQNIRHD